MNIIIEGPDGSGKSTLAKMLSSIFGWPVKPGEGPPKGLGEIDERIERYLQFDKVIFDRHPVISQPIYNAIHDSPTLPHPKLTRIFYSQPNIIIYCRTTTLAKHVANHDSDTPDFLGKLKYHFIQIVKRYDEWAVNRAHYIYRMGDRYTPLVTYLLSQGVDGR